MFARASFVVLSCAFSSACCDVGVLGIPPPSPERPKEATGAEETFWKSLIFGCEGLDTAERELDEALVHAPDDARTHLLYGMLQLWALAEQPPPDEAGKVTRLDLAIGHLDRYRALHADERVTSWIEPARIKRAQIQHQDAEADAAMQRLLAAAQSKPYFHSFAIGLTSFERPATHCESFRESDDCAAPGLSEFCRGLCALRKNERCRDNPFMEGCRPGMLWRHSRQGFYLFLSDYYLKAGHVDEAKQILNQFTFVPGYSEWPYKDEIEWRQGDLDAHAARLASSGPMPAMPGGESRACRMCHRTEH